MNAKRIKLLFIRYFLENKKKDILTFSMFILISIFCGATNSTEVGYFLFIILLLLYSGRVFEMLKHSSNGGHYLMIPASTGEKVLSGIILTNIYYLGVLWLIINSGIFLGIQIRQWITPDFLVSIETSSDMQHLFQIDIQTGFLYFLYTSVFMFGSVYFKRQAIGKTLLSILAFVIFFIALDSSILYYFTNSSQIYLSSNAVPVYNLNQWMGNVMIVCAIIYFWVLTYFRLKETEI
jgi:hypothetical protein